MFQLTIDFAVLSLITISSLSKSIFHLDQKFGIPGGTPKTLNRWHSVSWSLFHEHEPWPTVHKSSSPGSGSRRQLMWSLWAIQCLQSYMQCKHTIYRHVRARTHPSQLVKVFKTRILVDLRLHIFTDTVTFFIINSFANFLHFLLDISVNMIE